MLLATVIVPSGSFASDDRTVSEILELNAEPLARFARLQDHWLEWLSAIYQNDMDRANSALDQLQTDAENMGLERLPDLSLGAAGRAIEFAYHERFDASRRCIAAAESLDPGRSEVSFAAARVAQIEGHFWLAIQRGFEGYSRLFKDKLLRYLWRADLVRWLLFSLLASGAIYVTILMATVGIELFQDTYTFIDRQVPHVLSLAITLILLVWPILLPAGVFWLIVYWSILLWGYGRTSQKVVLALLWIVIGATPIIVNDQRQKLQVALAPSVLAIESLANGQLQGSLFSDLAALRLALPESAAVSQMIGDLHCRLGEWDSARAIYEVLVEREPENGAALLNLGVCHLYQGDQALAMANFQKAAASRDAAAAARFNMSQVLSELYRFREAERELGIAQRMVPRKVGQWLRQAADRRAIVLDGGLGRTDEVREELVASWGGGDPEGYGSDLWPRVLSAPLAVVFLVLAAGLHFVVRRNRGTGHAPVGQLAPPGSWRSTLLVGYAEVENGQPLRGYFILLLLALLVSLPWPGELGYRLPWIYGPGGGVTALAAAIGLALFTLVRLAGHSRRSFQ